MLSPELLALLSTPEPLRLAELPAVTSPQPSEVFSFTPRTVQFTRDHDFLEDGDVQRHLYLQDVLTHFGEVQERPKVSEFQCQISGCAQLFDTFESYEHHYNTLHRNVCSSCKRTFPSVRLLDIHVLEWHDSFFQIMAEKVSMYQCLVEGCMEKFKTSTDRKEHLIKTHLYPPDFRFDRPKQNKSKPKQRKAAMSMDVASMEVPVVEDMETCSSQSDDSYGVSDVRLSSGPQSKNKVPSTICFGHGSVRGFRHQKKKK